MMILWSSLGIMAVFASLCWWQKPIATINLLLLLTFPLVALSLYIYWGNSQGYENYQQLQKAIKTLPPIPQMIHRLQQQLVRTPQDTQGWYLLGRLYINQKQYGAATQAFAKANALTPHQPDIMFSYAQALFIEQHGNFQPELVALLKELHQLAPERDDATNLLALVLYQQKKYGEAIQLWEKLSENYPSDTPDGKALLAAIALAQKNLHKKP